MNALRLPTRRDVARGLAASAASPALPCPSFAQSAARVVVIGGGFRRRRLRARVAARRSETAGDVDRAENLLFRLPIQQRSDCRLARVRSPAVPLRQDRRGRRDRGRTDRGESGCAARARSASPTAPRLATTGWCCRPASACVSTRCPAMTRPPLPRCRTPGSPANRPCCCAGSLRPWTMAAPSSSRCRRRRCAARRRLTSAPA